VTDHELVPSYEAAGGAFDRIGENNCATRRSSKHYYHFEAKYCEPRKAVSRAAGFVDLLHDERFERSAREYFD
jgi:hypothetical protein